MQLDYQAECISPVGCIFLGSFKEHPVGDDGRASRSFVELDAMYLSMNGDTTSHTYTNDYNDKGVDVLPFPLQRLIMKQLIRSISTSNICQVIQ